MVWWRVSWKILFFVINSLFMNLARKTVITQFTKILWLAIKGYIATAHGQIFTILDGLLHLFFFFFLFFFSILPLEVDLFTCQANDLRVFLNGFQFDPNFWSNLTCVLCHWSLINVTSDSTRWWHLSQASAYDHLSKAPTDTHST